LIQNILELTPNGHGDFESFTNTFNKMKDVVQTVNHQTKLVENRESILAVELKYELKSLGLDLLKPSRYFVFDLSATLMKTKSNKNINCMILLFSDLLVILKELSEYSFGLHSKIPLGLVVVESIEDDQPTLQATVRNIFKFNFITILHKHKKFLSKLQLDNTNYTLTLENVRTKKKLLNAIKRQKSLLEGISNFTNF
jgi:hypothetical protein